MEITWYGSTCFRLAKRGLATVFTDPQPEDVRFAANIVTYHRTPEHAPILSGNPYVINGPGEYEIGGVFVTGIPTGSGGDRNTLYVYQFDPLTVADLGSIERIPTQAEIEAIGTVNLLLISAGGTGGWNASHAVEMVSRLEPNIVIPVYSSTDALNKFLKEMGGSELPTQPLLKVNESALPEETQVVLLENQRGGRSNP